MTALIVGYFSGPAPGALPFILLVGATMYGIAAVSSERKRLIVTMTKWIAAAGLSAVVVWVVVSMLTEAVAR